MMEGGIRQNILHGSFRQLSRTLILLLDNPHARPPPDIEPIFPVHLLPSFYAALAGRRESGPTGPGRDVVDKTISGRTGLPEEEKKAQIRLEGRSTVNSI
jgi:hypothetical protein